MPQKGQDLFFLQNQCTNIVAKEDDPIRHTVMVRFAQREGLHGHETEWIHLTAPVQTSFSKVACSVRPGCTARIR